MATDSDDLKKTKVDEYSSTLNPPNPRNSAYYLSNSDASLLTIITKNMNGRNYLIWRRTMKIALRSKAKLGFIDGSTPEPDESDPLYEDWKRIDSTVTGWILNSLSKDLYESFIYANTSVELWKDIETRFGQRNGPLLYQIKKELSDIRQGAMAISHYFGKLKTLWDELNALSEVPKCLLGTECKVLQYLHKAQELEMLIPFLMGLHEFYAEVRKNLLLMQPLPTAANAYSLLTSVESSNSAQVSAIGSSNAALLEETWKRQFQ